MSNISEIQQIIQTQQSFFQTGKSLDIAFRLKTLKKIRMLIHNNESELFDALYKDLGKSKFEAVTSESGLVMQELGVLIRNLRHWSGKKRTRTPLVLFPSKSFYKHTPYGRVLIISPWNYPFQLLFTPLCGAVAAGNCVLAKPSQYAVHTSAFMQKIISDNFDPGHICIIPGGREINEILLKEAFEYIFFTGSSQVGRLVMKAAAEYLTPVSLELGGKSPVIVEPDINLKLASRRILWGKTLNSGQSCVAPDYVLANKSISRELVKIMNEEINRFFGDNIIESKDYGRIINEQNLERLRNLVRESGYTKTINYNSQQRFIEPLILEDISLDSPLMKEEIFGPILPVISYDSIDEAIKIINGMPKPLALYMFTGSRRKQNMIMSRTASGTGGINETVVHFINPFLPFGGTGKSGIGRYHGKASFETFSYKRSFMKNPILLENPLRYPPYGKKHKLLRMIMK